MSAPDRKSVVEDCPPAARPGTGTNLDRSLAGSRARPAAKRPIGAAPIFGRQGKTARRRSGYMSLVGFVFSETALCAHTVAFERKRNDFKDTSAVARSDHSRSGCFGTAWVAWSAGVFTEQSWIDIGILAAPTFLTCAFAQRGQPRCISNTSPSTFDAYPKAFGWRRAMICRASRSNATIATRPRPRRAPSPSI